MSLPFVLAAALATSSAPAGEPRIDWFQGEVAAAFEQAKKDHKPLFLYWGAVWCPPCNQIKKTIFTRREFIEKTHLFLPVYLDGDTESAQIWGEKLGASGYPTMIVYSPQGKEVLRMPTGLQVEEFNSVLDQALALTAPVQDLLKSALEGGAAAVPDSTWRLLAYHSFGADPAVSFTTKEKEEKLRALEARIPARLRVEKSRLFTEWIAAAVDRAAEKPEDENATVFALSAKEVKAAEARLRDILMAQDLTIANIEFLQLAAGDIVKGLHPVNGDGRASLEKAWDKTMLAVESNAALSVDERLSSVNPALSFHKNHAAKDAPVPAVLQARVRKLALWADENSQDPYTRQSAMNTAWQLLDEAGLAEDARQLLLRQLDKAISPHYFMSDLAILAKNAGNKDEAVEWMRKAYDASKGRATRVQWGTSYLIGLIDLKPEASDRIRDASLSLFREMLAFDDAFAGRNNARAKRLQKKYAEWNKEGARATEIVALKSALAPSCEGFPDKAEGGGAESLRSRCAAFFEKLGAN